jgi:hypothetical protein
MNPWPASGYTLTSWSTPSAVSALEPGRGAPPHRRAVLAAVAADDRAGPGQGPLGVLRAAAVVDARRRITMPRRQGHRVGPAHAKADHADLAGALVVTRQPAAHAVDVIERAACPGRYLPHDGPQAAQPVPPVVQVGGCGQVSLARQPVSLVAQVMAHTGEVVHNDHAWPPARGLRNGHIGWHLPVRGADHLIHHRGSHWAYPARLMLPVTRPAVNTHTARQATPVVPHRPARLAHSARDQQGAVRQRVGVRAVAREPMCWMFGHISPPVGASSGMACDVRP